MSSPPDESPYKTKEPYVFVAVLFAILVAIAWIGLSADTLGRPLAWTEILLLMTAFAVIAGRAITGFWRGILIDHRFKMDLSRLQLMAWNILVLSALFTAVLANISLGSPTPLNIDIPSELWVLLGISTASAVSSPLLLDAKGGGNAGGSAKNVVAHNADFNGARWGDLLKGDEVERTQTVDLGKLQMFFLSFILIISYGAAIAAMLDGTGVIERLPAVDDGMNVLLGISHTGFLATKAGMRSADSS